MTARASRPLAAGTSALEEALRESEENFRRAFEYAPTGMAVRAARRRRVWLACSSRAGRV